MLNTPFGPVLILLDGRALAFAAVPAAPDPRTCPDIGGRYFIRISVLPDGRPHTLCCVLPELPRRAQSEPEPGDRLALCSWYTDGYKLSVGTEGEEGRFSQPFDYDISYLAAGMAYLILPETKTQSFSFGIAWISGVPEPDADNPRDVQTCFAADPGIAVI